MLSRTNLRHFRANFGDDGRELVTKRNWDCLSRDWMGSGRYEYWATQIFMDVCTSISDFVFPTTFKIWENTRSTDAYKGRFNFHLICSALWFWYFVNTNIFSPVKSSCSHFFGCRLITCKISSGYDPLANRGYEFQYSKMKETRERNDDKYGYVLFSESLKYKVRGS